jgi:hypothetical protein
VGSGYTSPVSRARIARWFIGLAVCADALSLTLTAGLCLFVLVGRLTRRQDDAAARLDVDRTASSQKR